MKKIIAYFSIIVAGGLLASCNLNETPAFSDSEAFVAFDKVAISVEEDTSAVSSTLRVPVRLTSLGGLTSTVTYQVFEGPRPAPNAKLDAGAQEGRDYELVSGSSVLTFTAANPVQYIEFDILSHPGAFTGDRTFGIKLISSGSVNKGRADSVAITILDLDHPLSFILGNYNGSGIDAWDESQYSWTGVIFEKDPDGDVSKVWIKRMFEAVNPATSIYGIVNENKTEISIPVHQSAGVVSGYNAFVDGAEIPYALIAEGQKLIFDINNNGTISIHGNYQVGVTAYNPTTQAMAGWFERWSNCTFTKQ
jgi:hypothetical protein